MHDHPNRRFEPGCGMCRYLDLQKQGFMRMVNALERKPHAVRKPKPLPPIVSCPKCHDWHRKGTHTYQADIWVC